MAGDRILVVDDEESVAVTMQAILEMDGYDVMTALSGSEAGELIRGGGEFDLVLTDLRLEDADGLQIIQEVRKRSPDTISIILTGYASLDSAVNALREGAYDYLVKPCDVEELRATVSRALERRRLGQQLRQRLGELEQANETISALNADLQRRVDAATAELRGNLERLTELDRLKSQFMSIASHELKTPVTAMSGFLQIALRRMRKRLDAGGRPGDDWQGEQKAIAGQLEVVHRQTEKLARLIDELLDVSRIQSGRVEFHLQEMDVTALVAEVVERMQTANPAREIRLAKSTALPITADRDHLEQVLNNLIANAIKYSPDGGPVEVAVRKADGGAAVSVTDHGIGIPAEELEKIFGVFYRSPDRRARDVGGMGLGLYISKEIVDRHGGDLIVESTPGKGSTFTMKLPRRAITDHAQLTSPEPAAAAR
ncbi:MAG: response regulator [Chloroflexi bacterium]|nr:response regulator [Chloroflexota bacterium]